MTSTARFRQGLCIRHTLAVFQANLGGQYGLYYSKVQGMLHEQLL